MPILNWPYIAGFFDGEGCVSIHGNGKSASPGFYPRLTMVQSGTRGHEVLSEIRDFCTTYGLKISKPIRSKQPKDCQIPWVISISGRDSATGFLTHVLPYLQVKKTEAQDLLRAFKLYPKRKTGKRKGVLP